MYAVSDPDRDSPAPGRDLYNRTNAYFDSTDLRAAIVMLPEPDRGRLATRTQHLATIYAALSDSYQAGKGAVGIPHA